MNVGADTSRAAVVLSCQDLDETIGFFRDVLGFRLETIFPADDPSVALMSGHGLRLRLERGPGSALNILRLPRIDDGPLSNTERELTAPNGTRVILAGTDIPTDLPSTAPNLVIQRFNADEAPGARNKDAWNEGRAGMRYRDLIPGRWAGHFIASHIQIRVGGPVPDYVHYHDIHFQMIYCHRGWVRLVYEDQGPPFVMRAGDCVPQPPGIRHRVLEASDGLEVIEIGCPALHATHVDHDLVLPTTQIRPDRVFGGQRFNRHQAANASWHPWRLPGFEARDLGISAATNGLASATVARPKTSGAQGILEHPSGFQFLFVLAGALSIDLGKHGAHELNASDSLTLPPGLDCAVTRHAEGLELLEVTVSLELFSP
jgi:quercetin dioxygenase-like cupin family protein